jgi:DNA primase
LIQFLHKKKNYKLDLLEKAGLIISGRQSRYYDRFRDRVIFPLKNHRGQVVGFSGRSLNADAKEAKYINSPETLLYHKSKMLFGYHELLQHIRQEKRVVVVEGEFDVMASVQGHVNNVVAIKGSALTKEHAQLLSRVASEVVLALDTDSAGIEATKKAIEVLRPTELELRVTELPEGKDPDELVRSQPKAWREAVKTAATAYEFLIKAALKQFPVDKPAGKKAIMKELAPVLSQIDHAVELEHYIKSLAKALEVKQESVKSDLEEYKAKKSLGVRKSVVGQSSSGTQPHAGGRAQAGAKTDQAQPEEKVSGRKHTLERYLLFLLFHQPEDKLGVKAQAAADILWSLPGAQQLVQALAKNSKTDKTKVVKLEAFSRSLGEDLQQLLFEYYSDQKYLSMVSNLDLDEEWTTTLGELKQAETKERIAEIAKQLTELDRKAKKTSEEEKLQDELLREVVVLKSVVKH